MATVITPAPAAHQPTTPRIAVLDILRGFALLGILVVNMKLFSAPVQKSYLADEIAPTLVGRLDLAAE